MGLLNKWPITTNQEITPCVMTNSKLENYPMLLIICQIILHRCTLCNMNVHVLEFIE